MGYLNDNRERLFPEVKDFSDPQNQWRHADVNKLTYNEWFWYHPSAYNLLSIGMWVIGALMLLVGTIYSLYKGWRVICVIQCLLGMFCIVQLKKRITEYQYYKDTTFYDVFVRDYNDKHE